MSVNNALAAHPEVDVSKLTLRCDNGSQYRSKAFRESMRALGIKLEFIYYTPEQNGHVESFHKTLKKEYLWRKDFKNCREAEISIAEAFKDYNQNRINSALGHKTPSEFLAEWSGKQQQKRVSYGEKYEPSDSKSVSKMSGPLQTRRDGRRKFIRPLWTRH